MEFKKLFDCENQNCNNKTDGYFCDECELKSRQKNIRIVICEKCWSDNKKSVIFMDKEIEENKYLFIKKCEDCKIKES